MFDWLRGERERERARGYFIIWQISKRGHKLKINEKRSWQAIEKTGRWSFTFFCHVFALLQNYTLCDKKKEKRRSIHDFNRK